MEPLQNAKDKDWQKLKTLHFYFSDPRSHWVHRKANTIKKDEVLLNGLLAQVLSDIAPKPSTTFSFQICPKPKVELGLTDSFYPAPSSSYDITTARNPNSSVAPIRISVSPRWPYKLSVSLCNISVSLRWVIGPTKFAWPILCLLFAKIGLSEFKQSASPSWCLP